MPTTPPVVFIGAGRMAEAIIRGAETLLAERVCVCDPNPERRAMFGCGFADASEAFDWMRAQEDEPGSGHVVIAVKPQMFGMVADQLRPLFAAAGERVVVSILAGTRSETIRERLGAVRVVRVMPNTPASIGRGVSAIALGAGAQPGDDAFCARLFEGVGAVERIDEAMMDAFTAVAGSGPAYTFYLAEAMVAAGVELGFDREQATRIVRGVVSGTGEMLARSNEAPEAMRAAVMSKGGTTAAACNVFDEHDLKAIVAEALRAARDRGEALARGDA